MIDIPRGLAESLDAYAGEAGRAFVAALPARVEEFVERWGLRVEGPPMHGVAALVLPVVRRAGGVRAAVKFQVRDEETAGEPVALRAWDGRGAVRLLDHDAETGTMLLERLDERRMLSSVADPREGVLVIAELLARLTAGAAPEGMRTLSGIAARMLADVPGALVRIGDPWRRGIVASCAAAVREVAGEAGDRLLHWDLHFENVLAGAREPWLAIDPKPLAGDPGFELWPALDNRFDAQDVVWRFEAMTGVLGLDRERARAWTLGRVLQNALWDVADGRPLADDGMEIARRLLGWSGAGRVVTLRA
ncbi:aminoglycoside phosphotransferase family protein [Streptomyces sp. NPDC049813]|uniref:aminoglycoside phosphotransferase family protein n=1 Tax=Streptomyces sp. NPDC049813 TaxID=3365597 RepID=UPI0037A9A9E5